MVIMAKKYVVEVLSMQSRCLEGSYALLQHRLSGLLHLFEVVEVHRVSAGVHLALLL